MAFTWRKNDAFFKAMAIPVLQLATQRSSTEVNPPFASTPKGMSPAPAEHGHVVGVAAEGANSVPHPIRRGDLVRRPRRCEESCSDQQMLPLRRVVRTKPFTLRTPRFDEVPTGRTGTCRRNDQRLPRHDNRSVR
jgi:hypothetical protein